MTNIYIPFLSSVTNPTRCEGKHHDRNRHTVLTHLSRLWCPILAINSALFSFASDRLLRFVNACTSSSPTTGIPWNRPPFRLPSKSRPTSAKCSRCSRVRQDMGDLTMVSTQGQTRRPDANLTCRDIRQKSSLSECSEDYGLGPTTNACEAFAHIVGSGQCF